ncbi:MAG: AI-2E family transporter [Bacteroidetes bacterium]|nr:AI-2E family transporter [Bacteroidota bacterium]
MHTTLPTPKDIYMRAIQYVFFTSAILYFGRDILILLSFALLISFVLYPICSWLEKKGASRIVAILVSILLLLIPAVGLVVLAVNQFALFQNEWARIEPKLMESLAQLSQHIITNYSVSQDQQIQWLTQTLNQSSSSLINYLLKVMYSSTFTLTLLILVPVFAVLILYYRHMLVVVSYRLFPKEKKEDVRNILFMTVTAYYNFIKGMAIVYAAVGVLNSIGLLLLGIPNAIFFGFAAAILTFIPYIGIMIGSLLPIAIAWITFNSIWYPIGVVFIFAFVQYLEANVIFPLAVSNRLKINSLATLVVIIAGGLLWGVAGMILFVPFLGITKLIADQHPRMKTLSILLGTDVK